MLLDGEIKEVGKEIKEVGKEIKEVGKEIKDLYGELYAEKDTSKLATLQAFIQSLAAKEKELISGRNALSDKLQPGGMLKDKLFLSIGAPNSI